MLQTDQRRQRSLATGRVRTVVLTSCLAAQTGVHASNVNDLDTIVVTGTRTERTLKDVPVRTEVIGRELIEAKNARNVAEALRHTPGVLLKEIHGKGGTEVWLQGMDSDRVLVLIDGFPVAASTGSTVDLTQIATPAIERIEIVKGAVSALYGSEAIGGVVNIITATGRTENAIQIIADTGSYGKKDNSGSGIGSRHLNLSGKYASGKLQSSVNLSFNIGDGYDLDTESFEFEGDQGSKNNHSLALKYNINNANNIEYRYDFYDEDKERDFSTFAPGVGDIEKLDAEKATRSTNRLNWNRTFAKNHTLSLVGLHEVFDNVTQQDTISTEVVDQTREAQIVTSRAELQYDRPLGISQQLTVGVVAFDSRLDQVQNRIENGRAVVVEEITPNASRQNVDVFAQNDIFIGDQWELLPGLRWQDDSDFGTYVAPRINALYIPEKLPDFLSDHDARVRLGVG
ncbi:MAG: TonB-dependent receptor, partial [Pseudomonadota bacterium]